MLVDGVVFEKFDSLDAFSNSLSRPENVVYQRKNDLASQREESGSWSGTASFEEAVELFNNGWTEKADEIRKDFVKFEAAKERDVSYQKSRPMTTVVGFTPHVPNAIMGLPNSMIYTERTPMKAKVVRIIVNITMNANTSSADIMNTGLTALKIAYSLERKGMRVRVDVTPKFSKAGRQTALCLVCVKDWRQPIDIKKVAFPIAHTAMFRRLGFRWMEVTPELTETGFEYGYGQSFEEADKAKEVLRKCGELEDTDYFLNVTIAKKNKFDPSKTAEAIGIKSLL